MSYLKKLIFLIYLIFIGFLFTKYTSLHWVFLIPYSLLTLIEYVLFIKKGNIIVRLHCSYKSGIRKKIITIKNIVGDNIIVLSGLNPGEEIVLTPDNRLRDGLVLAGGDNHNSSEEVTSVPADKAKVIVN